MESGSCLTRLADYLNANALREVAQLTEITFTGAGIALYLNVVGNFQLGNEGPCFRYEILHISESSLEISCQPINVKQNYA